MSTETLLVAFEGILVFGGALAFGLWQLRSVKKAQEETRRKAAEQALENNSSEKS